MQLKYRPEIDGLRAVAVLSVVVYHADFAIGGSRLLSGGFLGVDIFFVISGYLICSILLKELQRDEFSFARFYERRARRILPALLLVLLASIPFAWVLLMPDAMQEYAGSVLSSLGFASNIWFWLEDSYWAEPNALKPFLHTWSLAVEEQFYILFPLLLLFMWRHTNKHIISVLLVLFVLSLLMAQYASVHHPVAGFYLLPTRGWELLAGGILAALELRGRFPSGRAYQAWLPALGLVMLLGAIVMFEKTTRHPSLYTLLPIIGTVLIIRYGGTDPVTRAIASKPLVAVGLISYSLYLWHYPIFAFGKIQWPHATVQGKLCWTVLAVFLSYLSYRWVEQPTRNRKLVSLRMLATLLTTATLSLLLVQGYLFLSQGAPQRLGFNHALMETFDRPDFMALCGVEDYMGIAGKGICPVGAEGKQPTTLVLGDSHAAHSAQLFHDLGQETGQTVAFTTAIGCPPLLDVYNSDFKPWALTCLKNNRRAFNYAVDNAIKQVIFISRWDVYSSDEDAWLLNTELGKATMEQSRTVLESELRKTVQSYNDAGIEVVLMLQPPHQAQNPKALYKTVFDNGSADASVIAGDIEALIGNSSVSRKEHIQHQALANQIIRRATEGLDVTIIDPIDVFCEESCPFGTAETSYYFDDDHLSLSGYQLLWDTFLPYLQQGE